MNWIDFLGWAAASMVLATFYLKTMAPLRIVALTSNVLFISYGVLSGALPILALHCLLFPLNAWRLIEVRRLRQKISSSSPSPRNVSLAYLLPFMTRARAARGTFLFLKGGPADKVFLILSGKVHLRDGNRAVTQGEMLGLVGVFAPDHRRTDTAQCITDVEFGAITAGRFEEIVSRDPKFASYLIRTLVRRQISNAEPSNRLDEKSDTEVAAVYGHPLAQAPLSRR